MRISSRQWFRQTFKLCCVVFLLGMVGYWFYKFKVDDRDIGLVDYTSFKDAPSIKHPVASLYFEQPFMRIKMEESYPGINITSYLKFLNGEIFDDAFEVIDYANVTLDLDKYVMYTGVRLRNESEVTLHPWEGHSYLHRISFNGFSEWQTFYKCFEFTWDNWNITNPGIIKEVYIFYDRQGLLLDIGSKSSLNFDLYIHYPGQFLLTPNDPDVISIGWNNYTSGTWIEDVEILNSRNSQNRKCTEYSHMVSFDDMVRERHIINKGCVLPYFKPFRNFPKCDTREKIKESSFNYQIVRTKYYPISCQRLSKITYTTQPEDNYDLSEGMWVLSMKYPQYLRTITLTKEVDVHALIGNVGGYVGLFLGNFIQIRMCTMMNFNSLYIAIFNITFCIFVLRICPSTNSRLFACCI